jgi:hypothetical protein
LRDIIFAYPLNVQNPLNKKLLGFVIPMDGALNSIQLQHTIRAKSK